METNVEISFKIVDAIAGSAIDRASVTLQHDNIKKPATATDKYSEDTSRTGYAEFKAVEAGTYTVIIDAPYYTSLTIRGVIIEVSNFVEISPKGRVIPPGHIINVSGITPTVKLDPLDHLSFNGKKLCWMKGNQQHKCWPAVSGRSGFQTKANQNLKDKGPLPEGRWNVQQTQYQNIGNRGVFETVLAEVGRTAWPGGESSWGKNRIWLMPKAGTNTFSRSGFSIHGGDDPGSAGCIDLTSNMPNFVKKFREYGKDLELFVHYED